MKYNKEWLLKESELNKEISYFGFWGQKSESKEECIMSNFYQCQFEGDIFSEQENCKKRIFTCSEQYFMYLKAITFNDLDVAKLILVNGKTGNYYKSLGRKVGNNKNNTDSLSFDPEKWDKVSFNCMLISLRQKFSVSELKKVLINTNNSILVETSPFDINWGIGISKFNKDGTDNNNWKDVKKWRGENKLGFALMEIRDELNKEIK